MNAASARFTIRAFKKCGYYRLVPIVLFLCGVLAGCATNGTHLSKSTVISIAEKTAEKAGFKPSDYKKPTASYNVQYGQYGSTKPYITWSVVFAPQPWAPNGNSFTVFVDDQTKKAKVLAGY